MTESSLRMYIQVAFRKDGYFLDVEEKVIKSLPSFKQSDGLSLFPYGHSLC